MSSARERAKLRRAEAERLRLEAEAKEKARELTFDEIAALHFEGLSRPQQWVDRLDEEQLDLMRSADRSLVLIYFCLPPLIES